MKPLVATFLPLQSLQSFEASLCFLTWLEQSQQQGWLMLPIHETLNQPYRNHGIGIASFFYDHKWPLQFKKWLLTREEFITCHQDWLVDYALYRALSEYFQTVKWWQWPTEIAQYQPKSIKAWQEKLQTRVQVFIDEQYFLFNQMLVLKQKAQEKKLFLIGDLPFYIAQESSLVWSHQELFVLDPQGQLKFQSGVPARADEPFGEQFWGHPLYNWQEAGWRQVMQIFALRLKFLSAIYDLIRIDHANGFFNYGMMSTQNAKWHKKITGPGAVALQALLNQAQTLNLGVFLEDIASESLSLEQFIKKNDLVGMKVVTLLCNLDQYQPDIFTQLTAEQLKINHLAGNHVLFTSTHDTVPLMTWIKAMPDKIKQKVIKLNHLPNSATDRSFALAVREKILQQKVKLIIVPWQDWHLEEFRFNVPGNEKLSQWHYQIEIEKYLS